jgi:hypothetical protein
MTYNLIEPSDLKPEPTKYEKVVARIMAEREKSDVKFVKRGTNTTPDIYIVRTRQYWEIKNIEGNSKETIQNNMRKADGQARRVIISLVKPKCRMTTERAVGRIKEFLKSGPTRFKAVLLITKRGNVLDIRK